MKSAANTTPLLHSEQAAPCHDQGVKRPELPTLHNAANTGQLENTVVDIGVGYLDAGMIAESSFSFEEQPPLVIELLIIVDRLIATRIFVAPDHEPVIEIGISRNVRRCMDVGHRGLSPFFIMKAPPAERFMIGSGLSAMN